MIGKHFYKNPYICFECLTSSNPICGEKTNINQEEKDYMQYSPDKIKWTPMHGKFDADRIARFLRIKPGEFIYYRENEEAKVQELKWGAKYGR